MSVYRTNVSTTDQRTGLPVPGGLIYVTTSGQRYGTVPVGEPPYGVNSTPGIDPNALTWTNPGWTQPAPGVPYGFSAPVVIGYTG